MSLKEVGPAQLSLDGDRIDLNSSGQGHGQDMPPCPWWCSATDELHEWTEDGPDVRFRIHSFTAGAFTLSQYESITPNGEVSKESVIGDTDLKTFHTMADVALLQAELGSIALVLRTLEQHPSAGCNG